MFESASCGAPVSLERSASGDREGHFVGEGHFDGVGDVAGESEAHTADGVDHLGAGCCLVELAAQVRQVHVHDMAVTNPARAPDGIKKFITCAHFGGAKAELLKQRELNASGLRFFIINPDFAAAKVDGERAEDERCGADTLDTLLQLARSAEHRVATGSEFIDMKGSGNGIVGTGLQHGGAHAVLAFASKAYEVLLGRVAELFEQRPAIWGQEARVDDQHIGGERLSNQYGCFGVGRCAHTEA